MADSFSIKLLKNASWGFISYVWSIVFSIFVTPVIFHKLGLVDFGIFVLVNTITAFLSIVDLGLSTSVSKYLSEYHAKGDFLRLKRMLSSANSIYFIVGILGLISFVLVGKYCLPFFNIEFSTRTFEVFLLGGLTFFVSTSSYIYLLTPQAVQRFDISSKVGMIQLTSINILNLILVLMGKGLIAIYLVTLFGTAASVVVLRMYFKKLLPQIKLSFIWDWLEVKKVYSFGFLAALNNLASNALIQLDRLIIPIFLNPAQLSYYSVAGNVASKTPGIIGGLAGIFYPVISALHGLGDLEKIKLAYRKAFRNLTVIAAAITAAIVCFSRVILTFWLGKDVADHSTIILVILGFTYFVISLYSPLTIFLIGMSKMKFLAINAIILAGLNAILLFLLVPKFGILGAAWSYLLALAPIPFAFYWMEKHFLGLEGKLKFYAKLYFKIFITSGVYYFLIKFLILRMVTSFWALVIIGPLAVLLFLFLYFILGFVEKEDLSLFKEFALKIKNKFFLRDLPLAPKN